MAPSDKPGFWGTPTSTIDWCEDNYQASWYIAEFWNTVSNLSMIVPAIYGIIIARREKLESRFQIMHFLFLMVGIGSTLFHMTLRHSMQVLDEVPMIWGSCYMIYTMHMVTKKPGTVSYCTAVFLISYCILFVAVYLMLQDPTIFQAMYGTVVVFLILQAMYTMQLQYSHQVFRLYAASVLFYAAGFILWNIDNHHCQSISYIRSSLPLILQPATQLHAWWHLLAGYASYLNIQHAVHHRLTYLKKPVTISRDWIGVLVTEDVAREKA